MSNNEIEHGKLVEEFAKAGRTGRRNALPDVFSISQGAACGTTDLTAALQQLQTSASASAVAKSNVVQSTSNGTSEQLKK